VFLRIANARGDEDSFFLEVYYQRYLLCKLQSTLVFFFRVGLQAAFFFEEKGAYSFLEFPISYIYGFQLDTYRIS